MSEKYEFVTIFKGRSSITYLLSEWEELGENATPYAIKQNPSENAPFHKFNVSEADAVQFYNQPTLDDSTDTGAWDKAALQKLLTSCGEQSDQAYTELPKAMN